MVVVDDAEEEEEEEVLVVQERKEGRIDFLYVEKRRRGLRPLLFVVVIALSFRFRDCLSIGETRRGLLRGKRIEVVYR